MSRVCHSVANEWIEVRGDTAVAESYVIAFTTSPGTSGSMDQLTGGRYLDRVDRRGGEWKYADRRFVLDWTMSQPTTDQSREGMLVMLAKGGRYPDDPVYRHWQV